MEADDNSDSSTPSPAGIGTESARIASIEEELSSPDRVIMLSDGVFAIILTILVLELRVPHDLSRASLGQAVHDLRPTLIAWVLSFLIIGMYWMAHRDIFARVWAVNRDLVWLNLLFLLPCALIPFASSVLGEYPDDAKAVRFYGLVVIVVSVMRLFLYWYVIRHPRLLRPGALSAHSAQGVVLIMVPVAVYIVAMVVAEVSPMAGIIIFMSVPAIYFGAVTIARERGGGHGEAEDFS